jgi:hypothetical protein
MSTFTAAHLGQRQQPHPLFQQRDITTHTHVRPSDLNIFGLSDRSLLAYDGYRRNIDLFIAATNRGMKINTSSPGATLSRIERPLLPIWSTPVAFVPANTPTSDQIDAIVTKLGPLGAHKEISGKTTIIILNSMRPALIPQILRISTATMNGKEGYLTIHQFATLVKVCRCVTEFLCVNSYPAFKSETETELEPHEDGIDSLADITISNLKVQKQSSEAMEEDGRHLHPMT